MFSSTRPHESAPPWLKRTGTCLEVFHRSRETGIRLYEVRMEPIRGQSPYGPLRTFLINLLRKHSGLGARLNQDALEGHRGSAAMIDYVVRFPGHMNGKLDKKIMLGSPDAVRSRVRIVQDELFELARSCLRAKGEFRLLEVGPGYLRTQLDLLERLRRTQHDMTGVKIVGVDLHPEVVRAASQIIEHEKIGDQVQVFQADAGQWLKTSEQVFDVILAEGVFEYRDMAGSVELAKILANHLAPGGHLIASATHRVPKKALIEYLDIRVLQRSKEEFLEIYRTSGFELPKLIATEPPNVSVGVGKKRAVAA
jgi:SAM-dependent methyltransferase